MSPTKTSERTRRRRRSSERGFTLAALIVILTIMAMVVAYTVPQMWSATIKREHDLQTIWVMKQYARAIAEFQKKRGTYPVSLDQLKEQNRPRVLRQLFPDPLTGKMDWLLVPVGTPSPGQAAPTSTNPFSNPSPQNPALSTDTSGTTGTTAGTPSAPGGSASGPFIGVKPPKTGPSFITFNGQDHYEAWIYTTTDLATDQALEAGAPTTGGLSASPTSTAPKSP